MQCFKTFVRFFAPERDPIQELKALACLNFQLFMLFSGSFGYTARITQFLGPIGTTADSSPQTAAGHHRMTRPSRRSPSRRTACGFWIRAWGQREPARQ